MQYVIPSVEDLPAWVSQSDAIWYHSEIYDYFIYAVDEDRRYWTQLDGTPKLFRLCEYHIHDYIHGTGDLTCHYYDDIYVSKCNDGIRYHVNWPWRMVVVNANLSRPDVIPELNHEPVISNIGGTLTSAYKPILQFRRSFTVNNTESYTVNW